MKNKKMLVIGMLLMAIFLMVTGCAKEDEGLDIDVEDEQDEQAEDEQAEENEDVQDQNENEEGVIEEEREGKFVGWIDATSFEMDVDGETFAVRNDDNIEIPEDLDGKNVRVKMRKNENNQYIVTSLETVTP